MLTWDEIQIKAVAFAKRWQDAWDEKSEAQSFIRDLLAVFGVADAAAVGRFEERALRDEGRGFMDYFWPKQIAIEMKTRGKDLAGAYEQLKEYVLHLPAAGQAHTRPGGAGLPEGHRKGSGRGDGDTCRVASRAGCVAGPTLLRSGYQFL